MLRALFQTLFRKKQTEQQLDDELASYLAETTSENIRRGMTPEDALQKARRDLDGMEQVKENVRDVRVGVSLDILMQDVRYAIRSLRKNPSFAAIAILTLALGIGANTTIFSVVNGVLLKPLPYPQPERVVTIWENHPTIGRLLTAAPANFYDWREQNHTFEKMAALDPYSDLILTGEREPHRLIGADVTADFFPLFGVRMALGRSFQAAEPNVVVLSHSAWLKYFGGRRDIVGSQVRLNDTGYTVVGVLPRDFVLVSNTADFQARRDFDIWTNLGLSKPPEEWARSTHPLSVFGRLKPGVPLGSAQADLDRIALNLQRQYPDADKDHGIDIVPLAEHAVASVRTALVTLLAAVVLVLLIACANIANLLLTRAAARRKEIALRAALGANRRRIAQQLLTESMVLALAGSAIGFALAFWGVPALAPYLPTDLPRAWEIAVDGRVLAFTCLLTLLTGVLFGLVPLLAARGSLRLSERGVGGGQSRLRSALVVAQVAIALVLLVGAGLMIRSLRSLLQVSPGFRTGHILTARFSLPPRYTNGNRFGTGLHRQISVFQRALIGRVIAIPGVQSAGFTSYLPFGGADNNWSFFIEGRPPLPLGVFNSTGYRPVTSGYFETIGIPVVRGRAFTAQDDEDHPPVVMINEAMARAFWPGESPVGQRLKFGDENWRAIVGIAGDVRHRGLGSEPAPEMYIPWGQVPNVEARPTIVVRSQRDPANLTSALRAAAAQVDSDVPMDQVATMDQLVSGSAAESRFRAAALAVFALLALFVASIGLYGTMSYLVSQRTREFGIRMAVGATRGAVLRQVLQQGAKLAAIGVVIGLAAAALLGRLIASLLYRVNPLDAATLAGVSILLAAVALLASYIPARRAANADPMDSLRYE
jgi:putative ABC transport system permease protein